MSTIPKQLILHIFILVIALPFSATAQSKSETFKLSILHSNDLHSSVRGTGPNAYFTAKPSDGDAVLGHYGRLAYEIKRQKKIIRAEGRSLLLLDAGDFFAGSMFHMLTPRKDSSFSPELEYFQMLGYDAVTIGNHEFDAGLTGFLRLLEKNNSQFNVPLVSSNINVEILPPSTQSFLKKSIKPWILKTFQGPNGKSYKVAILGTLGVNGAMVSAGHREGIRFVGFDDETTREHIDQYHEHLQELVDTIHQQEKVQALILVTHGGYPEDEATAKEVEGIDLIIAGHTHIPYHRLKDVNGVKIAQAGSTGQYLGRLDFEIADGKLKFVGDHDKVLTTIDDHIPTDPETMAKIDSWQAELDRFQELFTYEAQAKIFSSSKIWQQDRTYANVMTDILLDGLHKSDFESTDLYMSTLSLIRGVVKGNPENPTSYEFADVFRIFPLGFDKDLNPGSPVVRFHLNKWDLRKLLRFIELYHITKPRFIPGYSKDLSYELRSWGIPFINRIKNLRLKGLEFKDWPELISIAASKYMADYIPKINGMSYGFVEIQMRDSSGRSIPQPKVIKGAKEFLLFSKGDHSEL